MDEQKVTRLSGSWYYLFGLQPGKPTIEVTLTNQHEALMHNGKPIRAMATIELPAVP